MSNIKDCLVELKTENAGKSSFVYSLAKLGEIYPNLHRLPVSIRVVLESVLRAYFNGLASEQDVHNLASYNAKDTGDFEIPFVVSRIILQDLTGVPLVVDLAAMRSEAKRRGKNPELVEPLVPVDLVIDHSVQMDAFGKSDSYTKNLDMEFSRNQERYEFLKWGQQAFNTFSVVAPSIGICHQVNLEYLAKLVFEKEENGKNILYPDTLVGTDSHTTMINGLGVVAWGVGGIEAEAGMLGQPIYFKVPEVVGVNLKGKLPEGTNATDLALHMTKLLREQKVVGKFVEYIGEGAKNLSLADRATVANMAPEYGATMGYFPIDEQTMDYMKLTGRDEKLVELAKDYYKAQGLYGMPKAQDCEYTTLLEVDLSEISPSISGPKRPQDKIDLFQAKAAFAESFPEATSEKTATAKGEIGDGSILIAAITSCTNTSNPSVLISAGLLAKKACEFGLEVPAYVKTTLAPGSRVVSDYLKEAGLQEYFDKLGFNLAGYGCATCIGNSGPIDEEITKVVKDKNLVCASVLSGNRNFEARVHALIKSNYLMSPPFVVAFALAGKVNIDFEKEAIGTTKCGKAVYLKDIMPTDAEIQEAMNKGLKSEFFKAQYSNMLGPKQWQEVECQNSPVFDWNLDSTYIQEAPFFEKPDPAKRTLGSLRALAIFGDSVTTDHISPAGAISLDSAAAKFLGEKGLAVKDFNTYGSRRGNDRIMSRGTFANIRIKNKIVAPREGGYTKMYGTGDDVLIYDAAQSYASKDEGLIIFSGRDYGMGSSRDWAAKGTSMLGVRAVIAKSYERIHRSNLVGMGILPFEFIGDVDADTLALNGTEKFSIELANGIEVAAPAKLKIERADESVEYVDILLRIDTPMEIEYYQAGGILPYVLDKILA
ncbi:MAG: aconitate hydratase AcnA [Opitutales bacterium]